MVLTHPPVYHGVGATKSGVQATTQVPWITEQPAKANGIPRPPEKVPHSSADHPGDIGGLTGNGAGGGTADAISSVARSLTKAPSDRSTKNEARHESDG